jgi:hypothetical protein
LKEQIKAGSRDTRWSWYFSAIFLPSAALAILLTYLIEGESSTASSPLMWTLCLAAATGSYVWAGLKDGPDGFLGRLFWRVLLAVGVLLVYERIKKSISENPDAAEHEQSVTIRAAGHGFRLSAKATPIQEPATGGDVPRSQDVSLTSLRQEWLGPAVG